jgi:uncharacterized repeat protein (TIGR01451 family)
LSGLTLQRSGIAGTEARGGGRPKRKSRLSCIEREIMRTDQNSLRTSAVLLMFLILSIGTLSHVEANTWSLTGAMNTARYGPTATPLPDGRVLVSGGNSGSSFLASAEIYDPGLGTWSLTGAMNTARYFHTATPLPDGRVLVSGGHSGSSGLASAETYSVADATPPEVSCGAADSAWHATNVSLACTAEDTGSGLADAGDASFTLETAVAVDAESSNAFTGSRQVCDVAGNCAIAGPIGNNKVDRKAPVVNCATADGLWHADNVSLSCDSSDGGSGLGVPTDVTFSLSTDLAAGLESATVSTGSYQVCDAVNNCTTSGPIAGNKVDRKGPTITSTSPAENATYQFNSSVAASYGCVDGGSGVASCEGPVANGALIDTSSTGSKAFAIAATDSVGNPSTLTVTYNVVSGGGGGKTAADVGITLSVPPRVSPGGTLMYSMTVTNAGRATATDVVAVNPLPAGTVFASASASQGAVTTPAVGSNGTVTVNIGSLAKDATATVSVVVTVTAPSGTVLTDTATVSATTQDLNSDNNTATKRTTVR